MTQRRPSQSQSAASSCVALTLLVAVIAGCRPSVPATLPSSPTAALAGTSGPVSAEVNIYLKMVAPVTTDYAILYARDQPLSVLEALVVELDLIEPPPEMAEAHALLQDGYQLLVEGGALLQTRPDPLLRSEAIFIQDWGVRQLWEHRRLVHEYLTRAQSPPSP